MSFKSYSSKRSAERGARAQGLNPTEVVYSNAAGQWGFDVAETQQEEPAAPQETEPCEMHENLEASGFEPYVPESQESDEVRTELNPTEGASYHEHAERVVNPEQQAADAAANAQLVAEAAALKAKPKREPRSVQNGQARPKPGGKCARVWDDCDNMVARGETPTPDAVKALAAARGESESNAQIELYAWRKYNGITGRVTPAKPRTEPTPQQ